MFPAELSCRIQPLKADRAQFQTTDDKLPSENQEHL